MTRIQQTSRVAFQAILDTIGPRQKVVLSLIRKRPSKTDKDYAEILGWEINTFIPRRNELMNMGFITESGIKYRNGRPAITWKAV